jgi:ubiquinone/menaquinone biosynthesis C-methylase UbiE
MTAITTRRRESAHSRSDTMDPELPLQSRVRLARADIHEEWERNYLGPELDRYYDAAFARIVRELQDSTGKTVLDLGCGYCYHTTRLARSDLSITGADFSEAALARARETLRDAGIAERVSLQQADATNLPFADDSFDNVVMWGVLMHIPECEKALTQVARILKPGGKFVLTENNARSLEVVFLETMVNVAKRAIGRTPHPRRRAPLGIEEWQSAESGGLMVRKTDMLALVDFCARSGLVLEKRFAGQFTEAYVRVPTRMLKRAIHAFNQFYFERIGRPGLSLGNILVFRKQAAMP